MPQREAAPSRARQAGRDASSTRSYTMSCIRKRDTKPELLLRKELWRIGVHGWRLRSKLPGTPDLSFARARLAVFVDGCFWHSCPHCAIKAPRKNTAYWGPKLRRNIERDARVDRELDNMGWRTLRIWEHEIRHNPCKAAKKVFRTLSRV